MRYSKPVIGIYQIRNKKTEEIYVGQSSSIGQRWNIHLSGLIQNKHHCKLLQQSFNDSEITDWIFEILEQCVTVKELNDRELHWYYQLKLTSVKLLNSEVPKPVSRTKQKKVKKKVDKIKKVV